MKECLRAQWVFVGLVAWVLLLLVAPVSTLLGTVFGPLSWLMG